MRQRSTPDFEAHGSLADASWALLDKAGSSNWSLTGTSIDTGPVTVGWRHAFGDTTPLATQAFTFPDNATLGLSYTGQFGSHATDNGAKANLSVRF